jgi:hypothetical protein
LWRRTCTRCHLAWMLCVACSGLHSMRNARERAAAPHWTMRDKRSATCNTQICNAQCGAYNAERMRKKKRRAQSRAQLVRCTTGNMPQYAHICARAVRVGHHRCNMQRNATICSATRPVQHAAQRYNMQRNTPGATCSATLQYTAQHARCNMQRAPRITGATCSAHHASCIMRPLQDPQRTARSHGACNQHAVHRCRAPSGAHRSMPVPPVSLSDCSKAFSVLWYLQPPAMGPVSTTAHSGNRCARVLGSASSTRTSGVGCQH